MYTHLDLLISCAKVEGGFHIGSHHILHNGFTPGTFSLKFYRRKVCTHLELLISCAEVEGGFPIESHYIQWVHTWNF